MIDPSTAQKKMLRKCGVMGTTTLRLDDAVGFVLAEDILTRASMPAFDNSAMDGYAIRSRDTVGATTDNPVRLSLSSTVYAGDGRRRQLGINEACGIMTGAMMPKGADAIIPIEIVSVVDATLSVTAPVPILRHVRREGEDVRKGARVARRGMMLHPGVVSTIASAGAGRVKVVRKPRVSLITTGDETIAPGERLARGQIYDSNSHMIIAMLRQMGIEPFRVRRVGDTLGAISQAIRAALRVSDIVIVLGGVSVGERDHVRPVLDKLGVEQVFWRVSQKPGKPIYFGTRGSKVVFGLPGNPASGFVCFYMYVYGAIRRMSGIKTPLLPRRGALLQAAVKPDAKRWLLLKASLNGEQVTPLQKQGSHMVTTLPMTNSLIVVEPGGNVRRAGTTVETVQLPYHGDI